MEKTKSYILKTRGAYCTDTWFIFTFFPYNKLDLQIQQEDKLVNINARVVEFLIQDVTFNVDVPFGNVKFADKTLKTTSALKLTHFKILKLIVYMCISNKRDNSSIGL